MGSPTDGILLVDKCAGETSHAVVRKSRVAFQGADKVKVGHAGTLDPFATGLLICLVGQGTKLSQFIMPGEKVYVATLELGVETDTLDLTGRVVNRADVPDLSLDRVRETARQFVGKLLQVPPAYSAVRCQGKRAYRLAREGQAVELRAREISVHALEILSVALPEITLRIRCSSGTYIRRLASDLGKALGTCGHLRSLRRTRSGSFDVENAVSSAEIGSGLQGLSLARRVIPMGEAIPHMAGIPVSEEVAQKVRLGRQPAWEDLNPGWDAEAEGSGNMPQDGRIKLVSAGTLVAILHLEPGEAGGRGRFRIERVFSA